MTRHSPLTGRFISHATFARWYASGQPLHRQYKSATTRWRIRHAREKKRAEERPRREAGFVERIISVRYKGKKDKTGTLLDLRVLVRRDMPEAEVLEQVRRAANEEKTQIKVKYIAWGHGKQKPVQGQAKDLPRFAALINAAHLEVHTEE